MRSDGDGGGEPVQRVDQRSQLGRLLGLADGLLEHLVVRSAGPRQSSSTRPR